AEREPRSERADLDDDPKQRCDRDREERALGRRRSSRSPAGEPGEEHESRGGDEADGEEQLSEVVDDPAKRRTKRIVGARELLIRAEAARDRPAAGKRQDAVCDERKREHAQRRPEAPQPAEDDAPPAPRRSRDRVEEERQQD